MPITIRPSDRSPESWGKNPYYSYPQACSAEQLLESTLADEPGSHRRPSVSTGRSSPVTSRGLVQSSFDSLSRNDMVYATKNGLLHSCIEAYNHHHNLVLRPDDVWLAILAQLGAHITSSASKLQRLLLAEPGAGAGATAVTNGERQHLHIEIALTPGMDHGEMALRMTKILAGRLADPSLREWAHPAFTTTQKPDEAAAAVLLLGAMQRYFTYSWGTRCGIPSVTLLGEADDWALIRDRCADRLGSGALGRSASEWWRGPLRPVLDGFVASFADPKGDEALAFWRGVCTAHAANGSGTTTYSGWITAFCYWDEKGRCLHPPLSSSSGRPGGNPVRLARSDIPMGFAKVPVTLLDNGTPIRTEMVAGSVGIRVRNPATEEGEGGSEGSTRSSSSRNRRQGYDTIQPETGWFMHRV